MRQVYFLAGLILGLAVAVFALQNTVEVQIRFLWWQVRSSLAVVVLASAGAGLFLALLFGLPGILSARRRLRRLETPAGAQAAGGSREAGKNGPART